MKDAYAVIQGEGVPTVSAAGLPVCGGGTGGQSSEKVTEVCFTQRIWFFPSWRLADQSQERWEGQ